MVTGDIAETQSVHADLLAGALSHRAVTAVDDDVVQVALQTSSGALGQAQRRTTRCVHLVPVMRLHDFDIVLVPEDCRCLLDEPEKHVHRGAEIGGIDAGNRGDGLLELVELGGAHARGTDDDRRPVSTADRRVLERRVRRREGDHRVRGLDDLLEVVDDLARARAGYGRQCGADGFVV